MHQQLKQDNILLKVLCSLPVIFSAGVGGSAAVPSSTAFWTPNSKAWLGSCPLVPAGKARNLSETDGAILVINYSCTPAWMHKHTHSVQDILSTAVPNEGVGTLLAGHGERVSVSGGVSGRIRCGDPLCRPSGAREFPSSGSICAVRLSGSNSGPRKAPRGVAIPGGLHAERRHHFLGCFWVLHRTADAAGNLFVCISGLRRIKTGSLLMRPWR